MKKTILAAFAVSMTAAIGTAPAAAKSDNAALVINQSSCGGTVLVDGQPVSIQTDDGATRVITSSGNAMLVCNMDVVAGPELTKAVKLEGFGCNFEGGFTRDTRMVITPSGKATAVCRVRPE